MEYDQHHSNPDELRKEFHHMREKICDLEDIIRYQRPLIESLQKERQGHLDTIRDLQGKLAGLTRTQQVRSLTDIEKNSAYSNVKGSVVRASED